MDPVNKDVKEAVCKAEKFFSVTLAQENLSPGAEKERSLLADKFRKLKIQLGCQNNLPGGGKAPPRPPKGGIAVPGLAASEAQDGEELYDDVAGVIPQDDYCEMDQGTEGNQNQPQVADMPGENYEVMSAEQADETSPGEAAAGENYMAMEDEPEVQEDYEEPQPEKTSNEDYEITETNKQPPPSQDEEYELPDADSDYEEADKSTPTNTAPVETGSMYEGVDSGMGKGSVDGAHTPAKDRSESANLDHFMKKIKPENIEGIICEDFRAKVNERLLAVYPNTCMGAIRLTPEQSFLKKLRKEGKIYLGSKWQKRYCVVRNHVLYYFRDKKSKEQAGQILLPGYKAQVANKKGREFILTHSQPDIRAYQFESNSKEETEKWMKAVNAACDAPLSERQTAALAELRNKQQSGDEDSLHYDDTGQAKNEAVDESNGDDVYDDTNEDLYEVVGTATQSAAPNQQSQPPRQDVDYEISAVAVSSPPASVPAEPSPVEPIQEEDYELPEQTSPALPPPRPTKAQPQPQPSAVDIPPDLPPPRPSKPQPASPPAVQQDELYEIADSPEDTSSELPQPPAPPKQEENYEIPGESPPPSPAPMRPPKIPQPPTPRPSDVSQKETHEKNPERPARPGAKPQPPPPPQRKDEPPQSPSENQTNEINYANIYQALWNCDAGDKDELGFRRGDLIYIYEKPHSDWWIGSLLKPQGYSVGLVPKQYVMEAYELSAA